MAGSTSSLPNVGYLRSCMDRRFVASTRRKFEELAGLKEAEYYHEMFAGGALGQPPATDGADYVYNKVNGTDATLVVMGWQVHLDHCGGLPGLENDQILTNFLNLIRARTLQNKYPNVQHIFLVQPPLVQPTTVPLPTTLIFDSTGVSYNAWIKVTYRDLSGQLVMWESGQFSPGKAQVVVPGGARNVFIDGGVTGGPSIFANTSTNPILNNNPLGGDPLPSGTINITLSGSASAPSYTFAPQPPPPVSVTFNNQGGYVAFGTVYYNLNGQSGQQSTGDFPLAQSRSLQIDGSSTNMRVVCQEYTGLVWDPTRTIVDQTFSTAVSKTVTVWGTTLSPSGSIQ